MASTTVTDLKSFNIDAQRGFLPPEDPIDRLPSALAAWDELGRDLPKLLAAGKERRVLRELPVLDPAALQTPAEWERAMLVLSYLGHAYVWGQAVEHGPADRLPPGVAVPWVQVAERLGRPPVLSYASYALHNWRRLDPAEPIALGNIVLLQNFLGGVDEEWFVLIHIEIEAKAASAIRATGPALQAVERDCAASLREALTQIADALVDMNRTMARMPERCDPYIYFHRVRPYLYGWKDQPALPEGLLYEGVEQYQGQRRKFRGETGAQSSIVPALDAALGITHQDDPLRTFLSELREYAPPAHRAFIQAVETGPCVRQFVSDHRGDADLQAIYDKCVQEVQRFRSIHLEYARRYIHEQAQKSAANPTEVGTGGTPFIPYLRKHRDETGGHVLS